MNGEEVEKLADAILGTKIKVIINSCYGGFNISDECAEWLIKNKSWRVTGYNEEGHLKDPTADFVDTTTGKHGRGIFSKYYIVKSQDDPKFRTNPDLIEAVETLGTKANVRVSNLKIVEIPANIDWTIEEYDGFEHIAERHRTWA